jgi:hypothetical protein
MSRLKSMRRRISSAHVIAMIALFVALSGSSYAAVTIRASQLRDNSIPGSKIKKNSIPGSKLKSNSITSGKLRNNSIQGRDLRNNTVSRAKLRSDALAPTVGGGNLVNAPSTIGNQDDESSSSSSSRGPQGANGPRGFTGAPGPQGPAGPTGAQGAAGSDAGLAQIVEAGKLDATGAGTITASCLDKAPTTPVAIGGNYVAAAATTVTAKMTTNTYSVTIDGGTVNGDVTVYAVCGGTP